MNERERWTFFHPRSDLEVDVGLTERIDIDDRCIVERVIAAYQRSARLDYYGRDSMWRSFRNQMQGELHERLMNGPLDDVAEMLRSPKDNQLLHGYLDLTKQSCERMLRDPVARRERAVRVKDKLVRLAEAVGALRLENPESGPWLENVRRPTDEIVDLVESRLGVPLTLPWFFAGFYGLKSARGVLAGRMIQAAYCAWRVRQLCRGNVLEIGAGLGYLACYARSMGLVDYTIVDLPLTNVAQGYYLMRVFGEGAVALEGEAFKKGQIRVLSPAHLASNERYDMVVNVDSLTEMGRDVAMNYLRWSFQQADQFWSVNHESNAFTVNELARRMAVERMPYWLRNGYVEELIRAN